ncbi:MAG: type IV toxin-antitoxin system AbiEi family antitoxin [Nanoarchaeota archaeon]
MISSKNISSRPIIDISFIKKVIPANEHYASLVISRLRKKGLLKKITKNKYTTIENMPVLATQLYTPCYLSSWSASQYYGYTEQILNTLQVVVTKRREAISFENYRINFIVLPKRYFFGYTKLETKEGAIFIAEPEKLLIDALLRPREMGNFDEIINIVKNAPLDAEKLVEYLLATKNISVIKRVGFLMEKYKSIDLSPRLKIKDKNYVSLNPFTKKAKQIIPKWRLKV